MNAYRRDFDEPKCMSFLIKDEKLLGKYNKIWEKASSIIKQEFSSNHAYNKKYIKTEIKSSGKKINKNFHNNEVPKEGCECICLSIIWLNSVYRRDKNYYPQGFLEEYKYFIEGKKSLLITLSQTIHKFILMIPKKKILTEKILMEKILMKIIKYRMFLRSFLLKYQKFYSGSSFPKIWKIFSGQNFLVFWVELG